MQASLVRFSCPTIPQLDFLKKLRAMVPDQVRSEMLRKIWSPISWGFVGQKCIISGSRVGSLGMISVGAPLRLCLVPGLREVDLDLCMDDPGERNVMIVTTRYRIIL